MRLPVRSLGWRIHGWHSLLLLLVLAGFGMVAYQLQNTAESQHVDSELQLRASALLGNIAHQPQPPGPNEAQRDEAEFPPPEHEMGHPPEPGTFRLRPELAALFATPGNRAFYYQIWTREGAVFGSSANVPSTIQPPSPAASQHLTFRDRAGMREVMACTPPGECLVVGVPASLQQSQMRRFAARLIGVGAIVLLFGLMGGWGLTSRAIAPIKAIAVTATRIAAGRLDQRIQTDGAGSELDQLAGVLNHTFQQLEAAFAEQARFTSDAAHELLTPVSVILAQTQLALARPRGADEYRDSLETTRRAALRAQGLIESLLTLARLDSRSEPLRCQPCDLAQIAQEQMDLIRPLADERGITLRRDLEPAACLGDPERLAQICVNLLSNAVKYNRAGGEVSLSAKRANGCCLLAVSDTGWGIAAQHLPHLFERFYRADASRHRSTGGAGLGLAICRTLAESQGGSLSVTSVESQGSVFVLQMPAHAPPAKDALSGPPAA